MKHIVILFISVLLVSCVKKRDKDTELEYTLMNPVTGQGYKGLRIEIHEIETKDVGKQLIFEGETEYVRDDIIACAITDENGYAKVRFRKKYYQGSRKKGIGYVEQFNTDDIYDAQVQNYNTIYSQQITVVEDFHRKMVLLPYGGIVRHFKNVNCFDANDKLEFKVKKVHTSDNQFSPWGGGYLGCFDEIYSAGTGPSDSIIFQFRLTRNNEETIFYDTFVNNAHVTDTFKIFY